MQFNFKKYITEKYLTEKLQSDTLIHELMNDTGHMFTYYKLPYKGTMFEKALQLYTKLNRWVQHIFTGWQWEFRGVNGNIEIDNTKLDTNEKIKKFNKIYLNTIEEYKNVVSKLFIKPDPQILSSLSGGPNIGYDTGKFRINNIDLFNLTDEHFEKYTWSDLKKDKVLYQNVNNSIQGTLAFWMSNGKILAVSEEASIILYAIDNDNNSYVNTENGKRFDGKLSDESIEDAVKKENLIVNILKCTLDDGTELEWPTVSRLSIIGDKVSLCGVDFVDKFLNLNKPLDLTYSSKVKYYNVGKFISKGSPLSKATGWGDNPNDYVIIYKPEQVLYDADGYVKSTYSTAKGTERMPSGSYNDMKSGKAFSYVNKKRRNDFDEQQDKVYKWVKDLFNKYEPYAGGKNSKMFEFGKKLSEYNYEWLYGTDEYCNKIALANIQKYKFILQQRKSQLGITEFTKTLEIISQEIKTFALNGKLICNNIKSIGNGNTEKLRELIFLYGTYQTMLNQMLSKFGSVQKMIAQFKEEHNADTRKSWRSDDSHTEIERDRKRITSVFKQLENNRNEMKELSLKIKTTFDE